MKYVVKVPVTLKLKVNLEEYRFFVIFGEKIVEIGRIISRQSYGQLMLQTVVYGRALVTSCKLQDDVCTFA